MSVGMRSLAAPETRGGQLVFAPGSPLEEVRRSCTRIARSQATALLTGETGTGKEVFARLIHAASGRATGPFVPVNCGAIPETLLESELFGYVKGAFTGASMPRRGRVATAQGGTLFLDEIGELPLALQVKLLRLLQERTYEPVGSSESVSADFRLVAATNRDLEEEVRAGRFRRDLFYRLNVCPVRLPALRERSCDVVPLFKHYWQLRGEQRAVTTEVYRYLEAYAWPGNVRELENLVERLSVCAEGAVIEASDLPAFVREDEELPRIGHENPMREHVLPALIIQSSVGQVETPVPVEQPAAAPIDLAAARASAEVTEVTPAQSEPAFATIALPGGGEWRLSLPADLPRLLRELENAYVDRALELSGGSRKEAASLLGLGRTTLVEKLRRRDAATPAPVAATAVTTTGA
jgi:sigma-54 specific flagellar transcriptional regulator A